MGYFPPGDDVRRLHQLETRFASLLPSLLNSYQQETIPLAPCRELVARWFGHPNWHAQQQRGQRLGPTVGAFLGIPGADRSTWMEEVPSSVLKGFAKALQKDLNEPRYPVNGQRLDAQRWTDMHALEAMAEVLGFHGSYGMRREWRRRSSAMWQRVRSAAQALCPSSPMVWARSHAALATSASTFTDGLFPQPWSRSIGSDVESGWYMGMTEEQVRGHTLLVGDSSKRNILGAWVKDAMRQGQGVVWTSRHDPLRMGALENFWNHQARLVLRSQDRQTLDLTELSTCPHRITTNVLDGDSAGMIVDMLSQVLFADEKGSAPDAWKGHGITLLSAVSTALVWERDHTNSPFSLDRLEQALTLEALQDRAKNPNLPSHVRTALRFYLDIGLSSKGHDWVVTPIGAMIASLRTFESQLFNTTDPQRKPWADVMGPKNLVLILFPQETETSAAIVRLVMSAVKNRLVMSHVRPMNGTDDGLALSEEQSGRLWITENLSLASIRGGMTPPSGATNLWANVVCAVKSIEHLRALAVDDESFQSVLNHAATKVFLRQPNLNAWPQPWLDRLASNEASSSTSWPGEYRPSADDLLHYGYLEACVWHGSYRWHMMMSSRLY